MPGPFEFAGGFAGGWAGGELGALGGGGLGTLVEPVGGTVVGAIAGGYAGRKVGAAVGGNLGNWIDNNRLGDASACGGNCSAMSKKKDKKKGKDQEEEEDDPYTKSKPPTGSKPIDQTDWSGDHGQIKDAIGSGGDDKTSISPDGDVWSQNPNGTWTNQGPAKNYVGSGKPSGRCGKDR